MNFSFLALPLLHYLLFVALKIGFYCSNLNAYNVFSFPHRYAPQNVSCQRIRDEI